MSLEQIVKDNVNGATIVGIDSETAVLLTGGKGNPMQGRVTKRTVGSNVMLFTYKTTNAYDNMVKRRLEQEGKDPASFQLSPRKWGTRRTDAPFVDHNDNVYLEVIFLRAGTSSYYLDGKPIAKADIIGLKDKPEEAEQGGLENKVIIRTYSVESIKAITINKERHEF